MTKEWLLRAASNLAEKEEWLRSQGRHVAADRIAKRRRGYKSRVWAMRRASAKSWIKGLF